MIKQDISYQDKSALTSFIQEGETDIVSAQKKIVGKMDKSVLNAEALNSISVEAEKLEQTTDLEGNGFLNSLGFGFQDFLTVLGTMAKGEVYNSQLEYPQGAICKLNKEDRFVYLAIKDAPKNTPLSNIEYWVKLDLMGDNGMLGLGVRWCGEWDDIGNYSDYQIGDWVYMYDSKTHIISFYIAQQEDGLILPPNSPDGDSWVLVGEYQLPFIDISSTSVSSTPKTQIYGVDITEQFPNSQTTIYQFYHQSTPITFRSCNIPVSIGDEYLIFSKFATSFYGDKDIALTGDYDIDLKTISKLNNLYLTY